MMGFLLLAGAMVIAAVAMLVLPLLRRHRNRGLALPVLLALAVPVATAGLYRLVGTPTAIAAATHPPSPVLAPLPQTAPPAQDTQPTQVLDHWMAEAKQAEEQQHPEQARAAYAHALQIAPDTSAAIVGWVAADMATHADFAIDTAARARLQQVVAREPDNQRGLWLLGISDFQQQDYQAARMHWTHLHALLDSGSPMQQAVAERIATAEALANARLAGNAPR
ncbi:tetratricopeptide repeat protein [Xanthomonas maliensis]|uniref:tetratricopeptide repeat protein n=1 Tax=Xanthomonas maliensis TaxID=1321368 RepID=UPI00039D4CD5|nr:hypothetical protein [Xanthomonas maliensis]KAB7769385.1 C-type cytochrome biogenesis protein [Xanthomonas maliensis]